MHLFGDCIMSAFEKIGFAIKFVFNEILLPFFMFLHNWGFLELAMYLAVTQVAIEATLLPNTE